MIPNKSKVNAKIQAMSLEERREYFRNLPTQPNTTEAQKLSQKENFAIFSLKGIQAQLVHLRSVPGIGTLNIEKIRMYCVAAESNIKKQQQFRKNAKRIANENKKGK